MIASAPPETPADLAGTRLLMTLDAVGGVWRYAMDLGRSLREAGLELVLAGFGPAPSAAQRDEAAAIGTLEWSEAPLDWMVRDEDEIAGTPDLLAGLIARHAPDILHLNLPSQAAGIDVDLPVVTVSHSCIVTWFGAVKGSGVPREWDWQVRVNRAGFDRANATVAPSRAQAALLESAYGPVRRLFVVPNGSHAPETQTADEPFVVAAGRWWDEGKNGATLDEASREIGWPVRMAGNTRSPAGQQLDLHHAESTGELSHVETMALMARAGIFVSPSLYEPFGLAALEAARCGVPLVLADIPTYRELWDGAATFFRPDDPGALAESVNRLIDAPEMRREAGATARTRAAVLTPQAQADAMLRIYAEARRDFTSRKATD